MLDPSLVESFRDTLFAGKYNLLLGSGVSLPSRDRHGALLRSAEQLRTHICQVTGAHSGTSLARAYGLLSEQQRNAELVDKYSHCRPGPELVPLRQCLWKRIFTLNIDDVIENLYRRGNRTQELVTLNFDSAFEPDTDLPEVQCIHLHGYAGQPSSGFVFSHNEYARVLHGNNPWMLLLCEILPSEPFIIAGTSFNDIDLEYYLARRTSSTPRRGRGPSVLVEPNPDAATLADCERYDLTLVKAEFGQFLTWIAETFPNRPSPQTLIVPAVKDLFRSTIAAPALLRFFSDFELVAVGRGRDDKMPKAYMYGAEPTWSDIEEHLDVERHANRTAMSYLTTWLDHRRQREMRVLLVSEEAATGKSTLLKRIGHDLASLGRVVFYVRTLSAIDVKTAAQCLRECTAPSVILVDNFADYAEQVRNLLEELDTPEGTVIVGAERGYRREYIDLVMSDSSVSVVNMGAPTTNELDQLLEKYQQTGLIADRRLTENRRKAIRHLQGDPIAVAVCRILNDFRPLDRIIASLWETADSKQRAVYLACALAHRCYGTGIRQSVMQAMSGPDYSVDTLIGAACPLPLAHHPSDDDFLLPQSAVVAERVLTWVGRRDRHLLMDAFVGLANGIAPRVNRMAVRRRTPEARLAGRLFDADKIVRPLLAAHAEDFYVAVKEAWEWNSRYWEQRALLIAARDIRTAVQFARHAVAIESHPLPLTTLGKVLFMSLRGCRSVGERTGIFGEAFSVLSQAISMEAHNARITVHPFSTLLVWTATFLEEGGGLTLEQDSAIRNYVDDARVRYGEDVGVATAIQRLDALM